MGGISTQGSLSAPHAATGLVPVNCDRDWEYCSRLSVQMGQAGGAAGLLSHCGTDGASSAPEDNVEL